LVLGSNPGGPTNFLSDPERKLPTEALAKAGISFAPAPGLRMAPVHWVCLQTLKTRQITTDGISPTAKFWRCGSG
jgi:hypothetical protein